MRLGYDLKLEQTQKLIVTPELRQAIAVLQMSAIELSEFVDQQLVENPCLEVVEEEGKVQDLAEEKHTDSSGEDRWDIDWQEYFADRSDLGYVERERKSAGEEVSFEQFLNREPSLQEHLLSQLTLVDLSEIDKYVAQFLIGNIDDNGYLRTELAEVTQVCRISMEQVERVLKVIQSFDPAGVGARDLTECLLLQIENLEVRDDLLKVLVSEHLKELGEGKLPKVAKKLQVSLKRLQDALDLLKQLDPKPGRKFGGLEDVRYVVPEIVVERVGSEYVVLVNDTTVPRLSINNTYRQVLTAPQTCDADTKKYVESKVNSASWLIKNIEQRRLTLYKVANCIVEMQRDFLDYGVKYLKPLTLKQVAQKVELHESTISRATSNKYIQTPQGVYDLKFFFTSGLQSYDGENVSSESIKKQLREFIQSENEIKPLSDQKMAEMLAQRGIDISRRTVAKYREELKIPAASKRKRY